MRVLRCATVLLLSGLSWSQSGCGKYDPNSETSSAKPSSATADSKPDSKPKPAEAEPAKQHGEVPIAQLDPPQKPETTPKDPESQFQADLDDAISLLEKEDYKLFIERYFPIEALREIRKDTQLNTFLAFLKQSPELRKSFLTRFKAMKTGKLMFRDDDKTMLAVLMTDASGVPKHDFGLRNPDNEKIPSYPGFPGDVKTALEGAVKALEAGEHEKFIENMFPDSEIHVTVNQDRQEALMARLKAHPQMVEKMVEDLKALQKLDPKLNAEGSKATFVLNPGTKAERTVVLEKSGTWKFADTAKAIRKAMYQQSLKTNPDYKTSKWERIRDHWRLTGYLEEFDPAEDTTKPQMTLPSRARFSIPKPAEKSDDVEDKPASRDDDFDKDDFDKKE